MDEKRSVTRSLCADLMKLEWIDVSGAVTTTSAVLEDISPRGACLQVETPVPVDVPANLIGGDHWNSPCTTLYCDFRDIGYFVGLEFLEGNRWSKHDFEPQHLLEFPEILRG